jgi:hypothetical protein
MVRLRYRKLLLNDFDGNRLIFADIICFIYATRAATTEYGTKLVIFFHFGEDHHPFEGTKPLVENSGRAHEKVDLLSFGSECETKIVIFLKWLQLLPLNAIAKILAIGSESESISKKDA